MSLPYRQPFASVARLTAVIVVCGGAGAAAPAFAAADIGQATRINESVTGSYSSKRFDVSVGDRVKLREVVRTNATGEARLDFDEGTNLVIFASSTITMRRFTSASVVMSTGDGTFAFNTGRLAPGAYRIETVAGTLTPSGTRFTFSVRGGRLTLDVQEGAVTFCPRGKSRAYCVDATPGRPIVGQAGAPAQFVGRPGPTFTPPRAQTVYTQPTYPQRPPPPRGGCPVVSPHPYRGGVRGGYPGYGRPCPTITSPTTTTVYPPPPGYWGGGRGGRVPAFVGPPGYWGGGRGGRVPGFVGPPGRGIPAPP